MPAKERKIEILAINPTIAEITIEGDSDLCLNKMNARTVRQLITERNAKAMKLETPNKWEDVITAIHWCKPHGMGNTYLESTEEKLYELLDSANNAPCISAFGLKKTFLEAVVQNGIATYSTGLKAALNILATNGLIPITFAEWTLDERLMSPKRGAPVMSRISHFTGWKASFTVSLLETQYSLEQFTNIVNMAGFGIGIGSGRTSGYGRYHVIDVK